jgi:hypothetical protein
VNCSRCNAEAIVKRGSAAYCAKCALARDWEDVIAIVQEERVDLESVEVVELDGSNTITKKAVVAAEGNGRAAADHLPADPFA